MSQKTFGNAINNALSTAMDMDDTVFIAGEGVGVSIHSDPNMPTYGLLDKFGRRRVKDTPVSEAAIAGLAVGASCMGLRPVVEIMFFPFITLASDMLVNHAGKLRYMSGGKSSFPLTVRVKAGVGFGAGSQHSHNLEAWIAHTPGLKIVWPSTAEDAKGLLLSAIFDPDPVILVEDMMLYGMKGTFPNADVRTPLGKARIAVPGADCTVIAYGKALYTAMNAVEALSEQGISCEVIDLRSLVPLDKACILESIRKTGRLVVVHEANRFCGFGAELAAMVAEEAFYDLKGPVKRVGAPQIPAPVASSLEKVFIPAPEDVVRAVLETMNKSIII
ncbi:alpha-ketoacid dehydrogenase subunit beta [Desulfobacter sp.]|uniref:alpha-ketoacid dehydrogenase subunit beta n=1 Tax=Desulfobacter sp. TaxID=2294 RepID=UPI000E80BC40|nr:alpha-ketoacid dehydrogenase subunit beta [Desulfobacter sp.]HBT88133.1 alpha-ketoacid dehydrogenase subunit beta [Desulfobacter sp.]